MHGAICHVTGLLGSLDLCVDIKSARPEVPKVRSSLPSFHCTTSCVAGRGTDRPSMENVVSDLEHALQLEVGAEASGELAGSCMSGRHGSG
jgi:hypothetical protein